MSMCSNTTNSTEAVCDGETRYGLAYIPVFVLGLIINAVSLRAFLTKWRSWTDTHIYMFNLVVADFAFTLFLPFRIWDAAYCLSKTYFCTFLISVHFVNMYASILTTTAISVHRYLAIMFPMEVRAWRWKKEVACVSCVVFWALVSVICFIFKEENSPDNLWTCYQRCKDHKLRLEFMVVLVFAGFLVPLSIVVFCSSHTICLLLKEEAPSEEMRSIIGIVKANMLVFISCYTPVHVGFAVLYFYDPPGNWQEVAPGPAHVYFLVSEWIASTNCLFDCISYYFLLKRVYSGPRNDVYELRDEADTVVEGGVRQN